MDIKQKQDQGITLSFDEAVWDADDASVSRARRRPGGGLTGVPVASGLAADEFDPGFAWLVAELSMVPGVSEWTLPDLVSRPGVSTRALAARSPTVTVDLASGESAVLLVESEGVVAWQFPEGREARGVRTARAPGAPLVTAQSVRFTVKAPGAANATNSQQRNVFVDWTLGRVRSVVLKFAARAVADGIVHRLEQGRRNGPVVVSCDAEPSRWGKPDDFSAVKLPDADARILLFVHGTFSSTVGAFGDLGITPWGKALLQEIKQKYHAVIGFDHPTLSQDPSQNAKALYEALATLPSVGSSTIDIVCHSRGALVSRWLIERILPKAVSRPQIGEVIFVGSTNAGTELARSENWQVLLDLMSNLALAGCRALSWLGAPQAGYAAGEVVRSIGDFVRYLVDAAVEERRAPGLAAMDPSGEFVLEINRPGSVEPGSAKYYSIVSSFRPFLADADRHEPKELPRRFALMLANGFIGALMQRAENDLVVNVASMSAIGSVAGGLLQDVKDFGANPVIYHTNYFIQPETVDAITEWLGLASVGALKAVNAALVDRRIVVVKGDERVDEAIRFAEAEDAEYVICSRPDPDYPGEFLYAASIDEFRAQKLDASVADALQLQESYRSQVVVDASFLRSLEGRTQFEPNLALPPYSRPTVVLASDQPVGVILTEQSAFDVLRAAVPSGARITRSGSAISSTQADAEASPKHLPGSPGALPALEALEAPEAIVAKPVPVVCKAHAAMPEVVEVGSSQSVTVTLSNDDIKSLAGTLGMMSTVTLSWRNVTVEVVPKIGFRLRSEAIEDSRITLDEPPELPFVMDVEVIATHEGAGEIWAIVRQGPVRCVTLVLKPRIVGAGQALEASDAAPRQITGKGTLAPGGDLPDVATLEIMQQRNGNETRFRYSVNVPKLMFARFESPPIIGDLANWVAELYADIERAWLGPDQVEIFHDSLKARGAALFSQLVPFALARRLWQLRQDGELTTVLVCSDEPSVPWEIAYLDDPANGGHDMGCFLGELGLCRWLFGAVAPEHIRVRPGRMRHIVPHYPEPQYRLRAAEDKEEPMLVAMGSRAIRPHYREVTAALQSGEFDLLHFGGHGEADGGQIAGAALLLEGSYQVLNGKKCYVTEPLTAQVVAHKAKLSGPDKNRPIVVLNACQVGRLGFNLTRLGGFAPAFLGVHIGEGTDVGQAGAFISSLWAVGDAPASVFAQAFYQALCAPNGTTIAKAVTAARQAARDAGDATWLAYAVYAHPNCLVEFTP